MNITTITRKRALRVVPPAVGTSSSVPEDSRHAAADGHPVALLMRLREEAASEIDRLIAFLDATDGDIDADECCEDEGAQCDDEGVSA